LSTVQTAILVPADARCKALLDVSGRRGVCKQKKACIIKGLHSVRYQVTLVDLFRPDLDKMTHFGYKSGVPTNVQMTVDALPNNSNAWEETYLACSEHRRKIND